MPGRVCWFCNRYANMTYQDSREVPLVGHNRKYVDLIGVYSCDSCAHLSIGTFRTEEHNIRAPTAETLHDMDDLLHWLPRQGVMKVFADVPEAIANAASEVHACLSINANRAAIALARAVVEATAKDQSITKGTLENKIDALADKGLIRDHTRQAAHEVRLDGNEVAHGDLTANPPNADEAAETVALMDEVLQEVYQNPARVAQVRENRARRTQPAQQS